MLILRSGDSPVTFFSSDGLRTLSRTSLPSCEKATGAKRVSNRDTLRHVSRAKRRSRGARLFILSSILDTDGGITPGITRRAFNVISGKFSMTPKLIRGRVHAVVRRRRPLHLASGDGTRVTNPRIVPSGAST
ncbi:MAG TPA: hypothetical protein VIP46_18685 [Pyrinomonadaceae bacterium]